MVTIFERHCMSVSANICITLFKNNAKSISALEIIESLCHFGWSLTYNGYISYLKLGDRDDFDWQSDKHMDTTKLQEIILQKELAHELVGLILYWLTDDIGISCIIYPDSISVNFAMNRKTIKIDGNYEITDFQWYLEKLLPPLENTFGIASFTCEQSR